LDTIANATKNRTTNKFFPRLILANMPVLNKTAVHLRDIDRSQRVK
jgi:hypothetical protein